MVQVASMGGRNTQLTPGQADAMDHIDYELDLSFEVLTICFIGFFLISLSCVGYFVYHCCPTWLPSNILNIRSHIYQTANNSRERKFPLRQSIPDEENLFRGSVSHDHQNSMNDCNSRSQHRIDPILPDNLIITNSSFQREDKISNTEHI